MTRRSKGQSTAEYAILVVLVLAAFTAMQFYAKRGVQAKLKGVTDNMTSEASGLRGTQLSQYEPYYNKSDYQVSQNRNSIEDVQKGGAVDRTDISEGTVRTGSSDTGTNVDAGGAWK